MSVFRYPPCSEAPGHGWPSRVGRVEAAADAELTGMINQRRGQVDPGIYLLGLHPERVLGVFRAIVVEGLGFGPEFGHSGRSAASLTRLDGRESGKRQRTGLRLPAGHATI